MNGSNLPRALACALTVGLATGLTVLSRAADFTFAPASIDGGGGVSSGGSYSVAGTVGQPDSGSFAGGRYSLDGGLWPGLVTRVVITDGPTLQIVSSEAVVTVSWTPGIAGFVLQEADDPEGTWRNAPSGAQNPVILSATGEVRFLRLVRP